MTGNMDRSDVTGSESPVTREFAEAAISLTFDDHPKQIRERVRRAVIDGLGNALLARETPLGRSYRATVSTDTGECVILGGESTTPVDAAFANAGLINALDWDDTVEGAGHPGASVIPTALAVGAREGATVEEVLNAVVIGYEASIRVARALHPTWERYDQVHGSGTRHAIGAATAAASLCCKNRSGAQEIIGFGAQLAPVPHAAKFGWSECHLTWLKDNVARAASAGVRAAMLADEMAGPRRVLDGNHGFWRMAGSDQCDWAQLTAPFGEEYLVTDLAFKPYPCCRWLHAAVEATYDAADRVDNVASIHVETVERVATQFMLDPTNQVHAEFSLPFVVRQAAAGRDPLTWYDDSGPTETPNAEVTATAADEHTTTFAEEQIAPATVTLTDDAGTEVEVMVTEPLGSAPRPLSTDASREKLRAGLNRCFADAEQRADTVVSILRTDDSVDALHKVLTR